MSFIRNYSKFHYIPYIATLLCFLLLILVKPIDLHLRFYLSTVLILLVSLYILKKGFIEKGVLLHLNVTIISFNFIIFFHILNPQKQIILMFLFILLLVLTIFSQAKKSYRNLNKEKLRSMRDTHNVTLRILGKVSEIKDRETTFHLKRVEKMIEVLVYFLRQNKVYTNYMTDNYLEDIKSAAYLHDIGKIGIPDNILNKKGKLTEGEFSIVQTHTLIGYNLLKEAQQEIKGGNIYTIAQEIARHHHERWDGTGYPDKLKEESIPLSARIMSIIDVYDALISKRSYKRAYSHEEALEIICNSRAHFDPVITEVFINNSNEIYKKIEAFT